MGRVLASQCLRRISRPTSNLYFFYSSKEIPSELLSVSESFQCLCACDFQNNNAPRFNSNHKNSFPLKSLNRFLAQNLFIAPLGFSSRTKGSPFSESQRFFSTKTKPNYYEVLGVKHNASAKDIRSAFLRLSKEYHPDLNRKDPNNHTKFVNINEAYSVLNKQLSRQNYDLGLKSNKTAASHTYGSTDARTSHWGDKYEQQFSDPFFYENRDRSKDQFYSEDSFYGIKGVKKQSDNRLVIGIIVFSIFGLILQAGIVWLSYGIYKPQSDFHLIKPYHDYGAGNKSKKSDNIPDSNSKS